MQWLQFTLHSSREQSPSLEEALLALGAASVTLEDAQDQPILEPDIGETPLWDKTVLKALFPADSDTDLLAGLLRKTVDPLPEHRWELLEDKDWSQEWKKYFQPIKCGEKLWICPSWVAPPEPDSINLSLDPGLAFGTGSHPTTHLCLRWLDKQELKGKTVIDYGCGSGILGIAALLLGAEKVFAVDNDPQALIATADNADRNRIEKENIVTLLPEEVPTGLQGDVMIANILAGPLIDLSPRLSTMTASGGLLCLSGILEEQIDSVSAPYRKDFTFQHPQTESEWVQLSAQKLP